MTKMQPKSRSPACSIQRLEIQQQKIKERIKTLRGFVDDKKRITRTAKPVAVREAATGWAKFSQGEQGKELVYIFNS